MRIRSWLAVVGCAAVLTASAAVLPASAAAVPAGPSVVLTMTSDPGDMIIDGGPIHLDSADPGFQDYGNTLTTTAIGATFEGVDGGNQRAELNISPPTGQLLHQGAYDDATYPLLFGSGAVLNVSSTLACNESSGSFDIRDIATDGGQITRLDLTFVQHCDGAAPALFGELRIGEPYSSGTVVSSQAIEWPTVYPGAAGTPIPVIVRNDTDSPETVSAATIDGAASGFRTVASTCATATLLAGASCSVTVGFDPTGAPGPRSGQLALGLAPSQAGNGSGVTDVIQLDGAIAAGTTSLTLTGSGGLPAYSPVRILTPAADEFSLIGRPTTLDLEILQPPDALPVYVTFAAPAGHTLQVGNYPTAPRYPFNGSDAGLAVSVDAVGCDTSTGSFRITQDVSSPGGTLQHFAATFAQRCTYDPSGDTLKGTLDYSATPSVSPQPVSGLRSVVSGSPIPLSLRAVWTNPTSPSYARTIVRISPGGPTTVDAESGLPVYDGTGTSTGSLLQLVRSLGGRATVSVFTVDKYGDVSAAQQVQLSSSTFDLRRALHRFWPAFFH